MSAVLASLVLTLQWCDPHRLFQHGWARIGNELSRDFEPLQLPVRFTRDVPEEAAGRIQVVLVRSEPVEWGLPPNAMGAVMSRSAPERQLYVFFPSVARVLGYRPEILRKRWPTPREERDLSRAFARVIAHEVIHAVLPARLHTEKGLTCWKLDRSTLLASRVEIDEVLAEELRSALLQGLTSRPAPSSN
ncbi:MAG: hypothetical protein ACRD21_13595 [Vicinamibacteria bacterium]